MFSGFSWESAYPRCLLARRLAVLSSSARRPDLPGLRIPTLFNGLFRQSAAVSLLRPRFTPGDSNGIFTVSSIGSASRLPLRSRLDPISVDQETLVFRRGGFSPPLSLLIPTFAFPYAPAGIATDLRRCTECSPTNHAQSVIPWLRYRTYARLLSTRDHSTSELLRTL